MSISARHRRAFTLLEVVVALGILGISLVSILDINSQAVMSHVYAKKLTVATLLARSKMTDLEQELYDKPLSPDDEEDAGDFSDEGFSSFKWRSKIIVPKTNGLTPEQLFGALFNLPLGMGGKDGAGGGLLGSMFGLGGSSTPKAPGAAPESGTGAGAALAGAMGPMAGMMQQQFTQMVDQLQKSVREVHLTVSWKEGKLTESIDLVTHIVTLGPGSDRNGADAATQAAQGAAAAQAAAQPPGAPGPAPLQPTGLGTINQLVPRIPGFQ
jgi:general secretion pathway protein I